MRYDTDRWRPARTTVLGIILKATNAVEQADDVTNIEIFYLVRRACAWAQLSRRRARW